MQKTIYMTKEVEKALADYSKESGISQSAIIRLALFSFLKKMEGQKDDSDKG